MAWRWARRVSTSWVRRHMVACWEYDTSISCCVLHLASYRVMGMPLLVQLLGLASVSCRYDVMLAGRHLRLCVHMVAAPHSDSLGLAPFAEIAWAAMVCC